MTFSIKGVKFRLSFISAAGLALILGMEKSDSLLSMLLSALLHELSHLAALLSYGERPKEINIGVFGAEIKRSGGVRLSYKQECVVSLAGPVMNIAIAVVLFIIRRLFDMQGFINPITANLSIALLNLLPIIPLDGGRAFYFLLCLKKQEDRALAVAETVSIIMLFPLAVLGFSVLIGSGYNFSLLIVCIYLSLFFVLQKKSSLAVY